MDVVPTNTAVIPANQKSLDLAPLRLHVLVMYHPRIEGRLETVTNVGVECGGRGWLGVTSEAAADGKDVWS